MAALNPQPDCIDLEQQAATPLVPNANSIRVYNAGGQLAAIKADGSNALPGGVPAGATGDVQFNNAGAFGNANSVAAGVVVNVDSSGDFIIDLSSLGGGYLVTASQFTADVVGNLLFQSASGDVTFQTSSGTVDFQGTLVQISAIGGDITISTDNGGLQVSEAGMVSLGGTGVSITGLQVFANNAAALSGGLVATNLYRTSTGQVMVVF